MFTHISKKYYDAGKLIGFDNDIYSFENGSLEIYLDPEEYAYDHWHKFILSDNMDYEINENKKYMPIDINNLIGKEIEKITIYNDTSISDYNKNVEYLNLNIDNYLYENISKDDEGIHEFGIITFYTTDNYFIKILYAHEHNGYYSAEFIYFTDLNTSNFERIENLGKLIDYNLYNVDDDYKQGTPHILLSFEYYNIIIEAYERYDQIDQELKNNNIFINISGNLNDILEYSKNNMIIFNIKNKFIKITSYNNTNENLSIKDYVIFNFIVKNNNFTNLDFYSLYYIEKLI